MVITNNPMVNNNFGATKNIVFLEEASYISVLEKTRDYVHEGHKLLTHPLSGSIKPNETPYKSIVISKEKGKLCFDSLSIIEESIETAKKFTDRRSRQLTEKLKNDFQLIDYSLIKDSIKRTN